MGIKRPQEIRRYSFCYSTPADRRRRQPHDRRTAQLDLPRNIQSDPGNALTWTFNPKVQGSRPWRPTISQVNGLSKAQRLTCPRQRVLTERGHAIEQRALTLAEHYDVEAQARKRAPWALVGALDRRGGGGHLEGYIAVSKGVSDGVSER